MRASAEEHQGRIAHRKGKTHAGSIDFIRRIKLHSVESGVYRQVHGGLVECVLIVCHHCYGVRRHVVQHNCLDQNFQFFLLLLGRRWWQQ
jgi:hypothetical protein